MTCEMHKLISAYIYEYVKNNFGLRLNRTLLLLGSVAPDYLPNMISIPHKYHNSIFLVMKNIKKMLNFTAPSMKESYIFSFRLGIIIHFVSDYFCRYHNSNYSDFIKHARYEIKLNNYFKALIKRENFSFKVEHELINNTSMFKTNILGLVKIISKNRKSYLSDKSSMFKDCKYSLATSLAVTANIITMISSNEIMEPISTGEEMYI